MERLAEIQIVAAGPGDAVDLARVHVRAWRETYAGLLPESYLAAMDEPLHARRWRRQLTREGASEVVLVAEGADGLVGYCSGGTRADRTAEISTLYLVRSAQKRGAGRALLSSAARVLQAREARSLQLWVLNGNHRAREFYDHLGGVAVSERAVGGWGGGFRETAYRWADIGVLAGG